MCSTAVRPLALLQWTVLSVCLLPTGWCRADQADEESSPPSPEQLQFVQDKVRPLLESRCGECHGAGVEGKGGLSLTTRSGMLTGGDSGPVLVPFHPEQSLLLSAVRYESFEMPPRNRLPAEEIAILERWIQLGAPWPDGEPPAAASRAVFPLAERKAAHWAWQPVRRPEVPAAVAVALPGAAADSAAEPWSTEEVDRFVLARLQAQGLTPSPDADRLTVLRRLYFDLIGLPPSIEQQERFLNDTRDLPTALAATVDELLASPHYGERWGRHWLDLVRYAETLGHEFDYPLPYAWRYRDYVIRALNADVPYDQFVKEHIAGDLLPTPRLNPEHGFDESVIATGFWFLSEDKHAPVDVRGEEAARLDNQIDVFSKTFLGLTVACARCHDHKFDAITAQDYYALAGFLQSSRRRVTWLDTDQKISSAVAQIQQQRQTLQSRLAADVTAVQPQQLAELLTACVESASAATARTAVPQQSPAPASGTEPLPAAAAGPKPAESARVELCRSLLQDPATSQPAHPFSLAAAVYRLTASEMSPSSAQLAAVVQDWCRQVREAEAAAAAEPAVLFADFREGLPAGWLQYGAAFDGLPAATTGAAGAADAAGAVDAAADTVPGGSAAGQDAEEAAGQRVDVVRTPQAVVAWHGQAPDVVMADHVSSARLAPRLTGVLQSPTFELTHPEILVQVAGEGSRLRLVIDGYVMNEFSELLFSGARQPIETGGEYRWIRLAGDVHRYLGHRCHLEFLDEGAGWFAVREVRFAPAAGAPAPTAVVPAACNRQLSTVLSQSPSLTLPELWQQWSRAVLQDPRWPDIAAELGMLPAWQAADSAAAVAAWAAAAQAIPEGTPVLVMCDGSPEDEFLLIRGSHRNPGAVVPRRSLEALAGPEPLRAAQGSGRLQLAEQLLAEDNPLIARVAVNRLWQHVFGTGLVETVDNFGVLGEPPSHPELLDWLADEFRRDGWSTKRLLRRLVLSRTYRQSSRKTSADERDPTNRWLHRAQVRRLEGEVIRDAMLSVSGRLQPALYGPSVPVHLTEFMQGRGRPGRNGPLDGEGRRSIYQSVNRNFLSPFMLAFDTPIPATTVGRRGTSNVPAQALILLNNEFVNQQAGRWAERLVAERHADFDSLLQSACRQAFCRPAMPEETAAIRAFVEGLAAERQLAVADVLQHREILTDVCHVLFNQKEFLFLD